MSAIGDVAKSCVETSRIFKVLAKYEEAKRELAELVEFGRYGSWSAADNAVEKFFEATENTPIHGEVIVRYLGVRGKLERSDPFGSFQEFTAGGSEWLQYLLAEEFAKCIVKEVVHNDHI